MKSKVRNFIFFVGLVVGTGSCTKDFTCHCIQENLSDGSSLEDYQNVEAKNENDASAACDALNTQWGTYTKTCTLDQ